MNKTSKIIILFLAIILAVGGVMAYAKTIVDPPKELKQVDQYSIDLGKSLNGFSQISSAILEDSLFAAITNKISVFKKEKKLETKDMDSNLDRLAGMYAPLFLKRSFTKFQQSSWDGNDHSYMLQVVGSLKQMKHSDGSRVVVKNTLDSLNKIEKIISDYRKARALTSHTAFNGIANAKGVINQAKQYANDSYLSNCSSLVSALTNIRSSIGQSHFRQISAMVEKLSQYRYFSEDYYNNTLVPQVDAAITEYENNASSLYGTRLNTNPLWDKAKRYYDQASDYYAY